jgi:hypothetical protein
MAPGREVSKNQKTIIAKNWYVSINFMMNQLTNSVDFRKFRSDTGSVNEKFHGEIKFCRDILMPLGKQCLEELENLDKEWLTKIKPDSNITFKSKFEALICQYWLLEVCNVRTTDSTSVNFDGFQELNPLSEPSSKSNHIGEPFQQVLNRMVKTWSFSTNTMI